MADDNKSDSSSFFRAEGVILVVLTATVYAAFLMREMGYADYFSIPQELIATSHIGLVSAAKALTWGAVAYVGKVNLVWIFAPRAQSLLASFLRLFIVAALLVGFALYPYIATDATWWWLYFIIIGLVAFFHFIWPLITQRRVAGYENKILEQMKVESESGDIYDAILGRFERSVRLTIVVIVAIMVFAYGEGRRSASEQEEFNLLVDEPSAALLRVYGEILVSANLDIKGKSLKGSIKIQKMAEGKWIEIKPVKIGRLKKLKD